MSFMKLYVKGKGYKDIDNGFEMSWIYIYIYIQLNQEREETTRRALIFVQAGLMKQQFPFDIKRKQDRYSS